ncbi:UNVERIFIED_CONTAM: hypothetical protein PYX00_008585 [Menopon gallinae]|uniref:Rho GTPase-activating protein 190 n=1 Tax=Menopon gallinae TaxID=328185 RepID=A0AAW2HPD3_9NEOP
MARKGDSARVFNISVVGLSGTEKEKGQLGVGKSCLCNRFMRSLADDYSSDHISVLSQTDFSGRVVNNDHFLYWGEVTKTSEEGVEFTFQVVEQTEFIDDASFQPFKGGKMEPYVKRCSAIKLTSAEKLMYICKNQLGIEKEYEQKVLPDGKINIDGFLCVFDVSNIPGRPIEKQVEIVSAILNNIMKTKKPVVLVTTKNDEAVDSYVKEAEKLINRKEYKNGILMVETSAHENVNVDLAFILVAQLIDRTKGRCKIIPFAEADGRRKELGDSVTQTFQNLIRSQVTDFTALWTHTLKKLSQHPDLMHYVALFGIDNAQRLFRRHIKKLKEEHVKKRIQGYMEMLPDILQEMVPDLSSLRDCDWATVQRHIQEHPDFHQYFFECPEDIPWTECDLEEIGHNLIPFDVLDSTEAETVYKNHVNALQQDQKRLEWKKQFKQLLEDTGYVTPGKLLSEVRVLFMGRECFEALTESDCQIIYDQHQKEIIEKAKHNFQELLLEHADLFYHFKSIAPAGTITQDYIKEITEALQEDSRYKALDRLDQDRKLMLFQHLGFVHCPIREHCPAFPNCMDALIERILSAKAHRPSSWNHSSQWILSSDSNRLNLVILGTNGLSEELVTEIRSQCEGDEYELSCQLYSLDYRIINGDVSLPQNSFKTNDFLPHGCFCIYSNADSFEYIRESLEKTLLSNLEQEDRLPFQGLPIVILFAADHTVDEKEGIRLREEGQNLADSLQCPFIDVSVEDSPSDRHQFNRLIVSDALKQLVQSIRHRSGFINIYQSVIDSSEPDIRVIMCMFCGDPYNVENVLSPLLNHQCCFLSGDKSIILETFLGDSKHKVEVIISSFHGANAFCEELVHGFILVYSTKRKASLATLNAFSMNIPNLPIQILAVTETGGANAFFSNDLSHLLITEGNAIADRLHAHFMTSSSSCQQKTAFYTPFFKEVWENKPEIEQAFHMEEPSHLMDSGDDTLERRHPLPPPRHESYHIKSGSNDGSESEIYERFPTDGDDVNDSLSPTYPDDGLLSLSDDSDIYTHVDVYGNGGENHLVKNSDMKPKLSQVWVDDVYLQQSHRDRADDLWMINYSQHAFTTGRRHTNKLKNKGRSHTLKQPGKLNLKDFSNVTDGVARLNMGGNNRSGRVHAPLATTENLDLEYAQIKDAIQPLYGQYDGEYSYTLVQDAVSLRSKVRRRRKKGRPSNSETPSDASDGSEPDLSGSSRSRSKLHKKSLRLKKRIGGKVPVGQPVRIPIPPELRTPHIMQQHQFNSGLSVDSDILGNAPYTLHDDESSFDVSSPRDINSPLFGGLTKGLKDNDKTSRRKEKQKAKDDEKQRQKEEKLKKLAEKEKEREKKKLKVKPTKIGGINSLECYAQSDDNPLPLFLEKCVKFIEEEGLDSEGIYRVPGNRAHVELLFQKFEENPNVNIQELDIPVNAVATALKDFFSKKLPPLLSCELMSELEDISGARGMMMIEQANLNVDIKGDRSCRLLALRTLLKKAPKASFEILKFIFQHFVRVAENCKLNSMDSKNLAICWWPTLLPIEFSDMGCFEQMRPHLEDIVQTMIDQYPFLFCGKEAFVMV